MPLFHANPMPRPGRPAAPDACAWCRVGVGCPQSWSEKRVMATDTLRHLSGAGWGGAGATASAAGLAEEGTTCKRGNVVLLGPLNAPTSPAYSEPRGRRG